MPFDFQHESIIPRRVRMNMARAGILNDPAACDIYLMDRFPNWKRAAFMRELHPKSSCWHAIPA